MFSLWLKSHFQHVWWTVFALVALPGLSLLYSYYTQQLGPNPLSHLLHTSGRSALLSLAASLSITPLRRLLSDISRRTSRAWGKRLSDWNWLIKLRRMLGLWCFFYASLHAWLFFELDLGRDWSAALEEVQEKPYLLLGLTALLLLLPLAATSSAYMIRRLGRIWSRLHRLSYLVALCGLLHFVSLSKVDDWRWVPDTTLLTILLGYRLMLLLGWVERWEGWRGNESPERGARLPSPAL